MPIRIHLFRDLPQERWPSMEAYADGLLAGFAANQDAEMEVTPISGPSLIPSLRGPLGRGLTLAARAALYPIRARRQQGEVNHVVDHSYGHLVHFLEARRTVVTVHDLAPLALQDVGGRWRVASRLWTWALAGVLKAARVIADSEFTRRELLRLTDYEPRRAVVVPAGVGQEFRPIPDKAFLAQVRARYHLSEGPILLHVGHGAPRKNLHGLLEAMALLPRYGLSGVQLVQVGAAFGSAEQTLISRLGLARRVHPLGFVPGGDLPALYNLADGLAFPSLYEGFGLPVLEAMACGTPVVCSNLASLPEVAGEAALSVDPRQVEALAEALARVLTDEPLRAELREAGLRRAAQFTWARTAAAMANVYREVWREVGQR
ncbi:MAG: glycosyltransferase family 4 protein [Anaerolineae bacterium]